MTNSHLPDTRKFLRKRQFFEILLSSSLFLIVLILFINLPVTYIDWIDSFRPAALHFRNPYFIPGILNPPWIFPFLYPLAVLPPRWGAGLLMMISLVIIRCFLGDSKKFAVVAFSAPVVVMFTLGQIDALVLIGLILTKGWGIPLLLGKPQGVFLTIVRRLNRNSITFVILVSLVSILIWGLWWQDILAHNFQPTDRHFNISLFPYAIPIGLFLAYWGYKRDSDSLLCWASLCFSPYFMITSLLPAVVTFVNETEDWRLWAVVVLGSWLYLLL